MDGLKFPTDMIPVVPRPPDIPIPVPAPPAPGPVNTIPVPAPPANTVPIPMGGGMGGMEDAWDEMTDVGGWSCFDNERALQQLYAVSTTSFMFHGGQKGKRTLVDDQDPAAEDPPAEDPEDEEKDKPPSEETDEAEVLKKCPDRSGAMLTKEACCKTWDCKKDKPVNKKIKKFCPKTKALVDFKACCSGRKLRDPSGFLEDFVAADAPWMLPNVVSYEGNTNLLTSNPGIWTIADFLDEAFLENITSTITKHGVDLGWYKPCRAGVDSLKMSCMQLKPNSAFTTPNDSAIIVGLMAQIKGLWPIEAVTAFDYVTVQRTKGESDPMNLHRDAIPGTSLIATAIVYLTDGGSKTYFPEPDILIEPRKGMAATWLNTRADGSPNPAAIHGVQASASDADDRIVLKYHFFLGQEATGEMATPSSK